MASSYYFIESSLQITYEFLLGILFSFGAFTFIAIIIYLGYINITDTTSNKASDESIDLILNRLIPSMKGDQVNSLKNIITRVIKYRGIYLGLRLIAGVIVVVGGIIGSYILLRQNELLSIQNDKIEAQNNLFRTQNTLLDNQSEYLKNQTDLFDNQNELISTQNLYIEQQNSFSRKEYLEEIASQYRNQLSSPNFTTQTKLNAFYRIQKLIQQNKWVDNFIIDVNQISFDNTILKDASINKHTFSTSSFYLTTITNSTFQKCNFNSCRLSDTRINNTDLIDCNFEKTTFSLANFTPSQEYALKQILKYLKYNSFENRFTGKNSFSNSRFTQCDFRYTDLRSFEGIDNSTFRHEDVEYGFLFGTILNESDITDQELKALMRNNGVIFNNADRNIFLLQLDAFSLTEEERESVNKIYNFYSMINI